MFDWPTLKREKKVRIWFEKVFLNINFKKCGKLLDTIEPAVSRQPDYVGMKNVDIDVDFYMEHGLKESYYLVFSK